MKFAAPSLLDPLPAAARERLRLAGTEVRFSGGERLISLLDTSCRLLILEEGLAKLSGISMNGRERILYIYRPGEIVGLHMLMKENLPSEFEIVAMSPVLLFSISNRDFLAASRDHPDVLRLVTRVLQIQLDRLATSMLEMTSTDALQRLARLLLDLAPPNGAKSSFGMLSYSPTHETMAQIIGASRPHTSMLLKKLERRGAVQRVKPRGLQVDPRVLREILHESHGQAA